ncbi:MAG: PHP domain-containing protein [Synergistaceae bacterium]|nr:PHP domain-containing protein [Synergistaceae bacterium]
MFFDIHVHTEEYSMDSQLPLRKLLAEATEMKLSGICITDHDTQALYPKAEALSKESGMLVIVGLEYSCHEGHLLVFGAPNLKRSYLPLGDVLNEVKAQGGISIAAHPFRWDSPNMGSAMQKHISLLDGVEAFNGGATAEENLLAYDFAIENGLPVLGGSDAHHAARIGRFITDFNIPLKNEKDFIRAIIKSKTNKKGLESISVAALKGSSFVPAYSYEKKLHERSSPPRVRSIKDILNAPRNKF